MDKASNVFNKLVKKTRETAVLAGKQVDKLSKTELASPLFKKIKRTLIGK